MGVLELIQQKAFVGKEFLTWLWFRAERDGQIELPKETKPVTVEILGPILLDAQYGDARLSTLKGDSPATAPEARTALLEGKKLKKTKLKLVHDDNEFVFTLDGENFNLSGLAVPNPGKLPFEDYMTLRVQVALDFDALLGQLLETFLALRLDAGAWAPELIQIQQWVREK
jgi:hypothetical protein